MGKFQLFRRGHGFTSYVNVWCGRCWTKRRRVRSNKKKCFTVNLEGWRETQEPRVSWERHHIFLSNWTISLDRVREDGRWSTTDVCGWNIRFFGTSNNFFHGTQRLWYLKGKPIWSSIFLWLWNLGLYTVDNPIVILCISLYEVLDRSKNSKDPHFGGVDLWNVGLLSDRGIIMTKPWDREAPKPEPPTNCRPIVVLYPWCRPMIYTILVRCNAHFPTIDPKKIQNYPPAAPVATFLVAAGPLQHFDLPKCCAECTGKGRQARCSNTLRF